MNQKRKQYSDEFKFRVALEAMKEEKTLSELSSQYKVHTTQISNWKRELKENGASLYSQQKNQNRQSEEGLVSELYEQIGRLKMELEWVKKTVTAKVGYRNIMTSK
ncbi:transposase [Chloroflexi bacterium TSY]|nr:transposase [Chloroflexi bacterium TSY]